MKKLFLFVVLGAAITFTSCNRYGEKVKISDHTEVYINDKATEEDAKKLGSYLDETYKSANDRSFQLFKTDDSYIIKMVVDEDAYEKNPALEQSFMALRYLFASKVFPDKNVKLVLTNNKFHDIKTVKDTTFAD